MFLTEEDVVASLLRERRASFRAGPMVPFNAKVLKGTMERLSRAGEPHGLTATQFLRVLVDCCCPAVEATSSETTSRKVRKPRKAAGEEVAHGA